jgi:hypothetical protein
MARQVLGHRGPHFHAKFPILSFARLEASFDSRRWSTPPVEESTKQPLL